MCSSMSASNSSSGRSRPHCIKCAYSMQCAGDLRMMLIQSYCVNNVTWDPQEICSHVTRLCIALRRIKQHSILANQWANAVMTELCTAHLEVRVASAKQPQPYACATCQEGRNVCGFGSLEQSGEDYRPGCFSKCTEWELDLWWEKPQGALKAWCEARDNDTCMPFEALSATINQWLDCCQVWLAI